MRRFGEDRFPPWLPWLGGALFSCLFIWSVAAVFTNGSTYDVLDPLLGRYVRAPGLEVRWRTEGWASTRFGAHGMLAEGDLVLAGPGPKFIFWGDSHAEAFQVPDDCKAMSVFNRLPDRVKPKGATMATSGLSVPDYYFDIPRLERAYPGIVGNVILLNGMGDVLPGRHLECHSRFLRHPWRLEESHCIPTATGLRYGAWIHRLGVEFLYTLYRDARDHDYRFAPGPAGAGPAKSCEPERFDDMDAGWDFLLGALRKETRGFLLFVYCPMVPVFEAGRLVREDPEAGLKGFFRQACARHGIGFVDLSGRFDELYRASGRFPRGFFNSIPGLGHLNERGQALVAEALNDYLKGAGL